MPLGICRGISRQSEIKGLDQTMYSPMWKQIDQQKKGNRSSAGMWGKLHHRMEKRKSI